MRRFDVVHAADLYGPRRAVKEVGELLGFSRTDCQELAIVVSELTSNILKYGVRGSIELDAYAHAAQGDGILVVARDIGPPFRNLELAKQDGCDDRGPIDPGSLLRRGGPAPASARCCASATASRSRTPSAARPSASFAIANGRGNKPRSV